MKRIDGEFDRDIAGKFNRELEIPEGLSEKNIVNLLKEKQIKPKKVISLKIIPKVISAAAAFILISVAAFYIGLDSDFVTVVPTQSEGSSGEIKTECLTGENPAPLKLAKSRSDLENLFIKDYAENKVENITRGIGSFGFEYFNVKAEDAVMDNMAPTSAAAAPAPAPMAPQASPESTGSSAVEYAGTNVQVEGVDEGDIIKNDGRYIYSVNGYYDVEGRRTSVLTIIDAESMKKVYQGSITLRKKNEKIIINAIYVKGDRLIAVCSYEEGTYIVVYDITDRSAPKEIRRVGQDGRYRSSRMTGDVVYTVTNHYVWGDTLKQIKEKSVPCVDGKAMSYDRCYIADENSKSYTVLTAFETDKTDSEVSSLSVLGGGDDVYCTADTLYVYGYDYDTDSQTEGTVIYSFSIDGTDIRQKASGRVQGVTVNQYSLDEYKGYLRIATTYYDYRHNTDVSGVYVLDKKLMKVGQVTDIAHDEQVKSVRFMGDTGYVVTFRNTDPLFIIDFSEPTAPVVTGELKIPGYSAYLHMLDEKYLMGIGYDGDESSADTDSVKISVFDVSDKTKPILKDSMVIKKASSTVNTNPKAFVYYKSRSTVFIPVIHNRNGNQVKSLQSVRISDGKIEQDYGFIHGAEDFSSGGYFGAFYLYDEFFRGTYIGDSLYTLDNYRIVEHSLTSGEKERECEIYSGTEKKKSEVATQPPVLYGTESASSYVLID